MFYLACHKANYSYLDKNAESWKEAHGEKRENGFWLPKESLQLLIQKIETQPLLISKSAARVLDVIASIVFIAFSLLGFTGVLPNISLGGNIAMITIGSLNLILSLVCSASPNGFEYKSNIKDPVLAAIMNRLHKDF